MIKNRIEKFIKKFDNLFNGRIINILNDINDNLKNILSLLSDNKSSNKLECSYDNFDETKLYRGYNIIISDYVKIRQPSLDEIIEYGEQRYYSMVHTLCSVGADLKWQLDDLGVDYTKISDYELFYYLLSRGFSKEETKILFGDTLDFSQMQVMYNTNLEDNVLIQFLDEENYIQIDRYTYSSIVNILRKLHKLKRNDEIPGNEATRQVLIEDAREEYEENKNKPFKPFLLPLISTLVNSSGFKRNEEDVFNMKIYPFMDSVARIGKIKNADLLLQSGYSGFGVDLKKINKEETNWFGELD